MWGGVDASKWLNSKFSLSLSDYATWIGYKESELSSGRKLSLSNDFRNRFMVSIQFFPSKKWSAGADLGINVSRTGANGEYKSHVTPRFGINGMWTSSKVMFRLNYTATTRNVALSQEQDYGSFTDSLIYHCGNPLLSPSLAHNVNAMVNILRVLTISGRFTRTHNAIFDIVESGNGMRPDGIVGNYASFQYQNGNSTIWKGNISYNQTFKKSWTISVTASIMKERASFGSYSSSKTLPEYDWYVMYNNSKAALQAYLSSSLHTTLFVTPQQLSWGQYDGYSLSLVKFLFSYKLQLMAMWRMPFHFIKEPTKSELTSPAYVLHTTYDTYRRSENQLTFTVVWRFQGGKKTRKYNRQEESVDLY